MPIAQTTLSRKTEDLMTPLLAALMIVLFLFYIDEGYYSFRWMLEWGNWIVFGLYMLIFFPVQWAISHFVFHKLDGWKKMAAMIGIGIPATYLFFWLVF
jgi:hypothetical protein